MNKTPRWMFTTLIIAGFYNLIWGAWIILFPKLSFTLLGVEPASPIEIWQCVGMIVGVYGFGYIIAATNPFRHWPIVLVGFLGKIFGPIGFSKALITGVFPLSFGINIIFNDLIWWIPFFIILKETYKHHNNEIFENIELDEFINEEKETLLVALRHQGCTFTRENISHLASLISEIESKQWQLKIIHMGDNQELIELLKQYNIKKMPLLISDPERLIYNKLGFIKGSVNQLFGLKVWVKGIKAFFNGHGLGPLRGNGFQLGGMVLFKGHEQVQYFKSTNASDIFPISSWLKDC
jgi:hypothetical protein